jgi:DNA polymerase III subunit epsilon
VPQPPFDEAHAVAALEATGRYRILRKLDPLTQLHAEDDSKKRVALFVDVETTGLDPARDEIIELAMVRFTYNADGVIYRVEEAYHGYQEPSVPITPDITRLTGIDAAMVAGQSLDRTAIAACIAKADLILAHNAAFDRKFLERFCDGFVHKPWGCSQSQIDWKAEGFEGTRLAYLVAGAGYFYDQHRALNDCYAAIMLLSQILPVSQTRALRTLLEAARRKDIRIFASHAPFDKKDQLRARGYRWNGEGVGASRAWFIDMPEAEMENEIAWLEADIYYGAADLYRLRIDALNRFSARV